MQVWGAQQRVVPVELGQVGWVCPQMTMAYWLQPAVVSVIRRLRQIA